VALRAFLCAWPLAALVASVAGAAPSLRFQSGDAVREVALEELVRRCGVAEVEVDDPYHEERRRYRAVALDCALVLGFGGIPEGFGEEELVLRAHDGYARPATGAQLLAPGGWLAIADAARHERGLPGFDPIDRRQVDPGPFYLVWAGADAGDPHRHPWPYQLASIEIVAFEERFSHTVPRAAGEGDPAWRGFATFRRECIACHAMNGQGGTVGPELNVPQSIVEYRPVEQIKQYVRDPAAFRYTSMPAHLHLSDDDLDDLVAYFRVMSAAKRDPGAQDGETAPP
jgi:mono/diheme cytochrome c family protein